MQRYRIKAEDNDWFKTYITVYNPTNVIGGIVDRYSERYTIPPGMQETIHDSKIKSSSLS